MLTQWLWIWYGCCHVAVTLYTPSSSSSSSYHHHWAGCELDCSDSECGLIADFSEEPYGTSVCIEFFIFGYEFSLTSAYIP